MTDRTNDQEAANEARDAMDRGDRNEPEIVETLDRSFKSLITPLVDQDPDADAREEQREANDDESRD
jgi:hypothetical protein